MEDQATRAEQAVAPPQLPHDALVRLFEYLPLRDLLAVRGVCSRWRDAALSRAPWRHRAIPQRGVMHRGRLDYSHRHIKAALRLAPCLRRLCLDLVSLPDVPVNDVRCAVSAAEVECALDLDIFNVSEAVRKEVWRWDVHQTLRVVTALLSKGLEDLSLLKFDADSNSLRLLLRTIRGTRLTALRLDIARPGGYRPKPGLVALRGQNDASLQKLEFASPDWIVDPEMTHSSAWPPPVLALEFLLQTHAPTLTTLSLVDLPRDFPAALLAACTNLKELKCEVLEGMQALLQCGALESLHLVMTSPGLEARPAALRGLRDLFAEAASLSRVALSYRKRRLTWPDIANEDALLEGNMLLLRTLAETRGSLLTTFSVENGVTWKTVGLRIYPDFPLECVRYAELGSLLPSFTALTRLTVSYLGLARDCVPGLQSLLGAIGPATTPQLRLLLLLGLGLCPDAHDPDNSGRHVVPEVRSLMHRLPALHVAGMVQCDVCRVTDCHMKLECDRCWTAGGDAGRLGYSYADGGSQFGLYSHDEDQPCDWHVPLRYVDCDQDVSYGRWDWVKLQV